MIYSPGAGALILVDWWIREKSGSERSCEWGLGVDIFVWLRVERIASYVAAGAGVTVVRRLT